MLKLKDYSEISLASIDVNPISYYADDKDGQVMEISREQDFISTAKFRPGPKRKTLKKEKRPRYKNNFENVFIQIHFLFLYTKYLLEGRTIVSCVVKTV